MSDPANAPQELRTSAASVASTAKAVSHSSDRSTELAADRTLLAAERTYAAWVRTALAALASGVGARTLLAKVVPAWMAQVTGSVLVLFAGFCFVAAIWRQTREAVPPPRPDLRPIPRALLIAVNGFLLLVTLAILVGLWAA